MIDDEQEDYANDMRRNIQGVKRGENKTKMGQDALTNSQKKRRGGLSQYNQSDIVGGGMVNLRESIANSEGLSKQQSPDESPIKDFARANVNRSKRTI